MPFIFPDSGVNTDYFTDYNASGGEGGSSFKFLSSEGAILIKIKAWTIDWRIRGFEVWMSDGSSFLAGTREGSSDEFQFQSGETITKLNVQASAPYSSKLQRRRLGAIWFETNKSRNWGIFSKYLTEDGRYWPEVGSGICCGIFGGTGDDVDRLGFALLRDIKNSLITNVTYPKLSMQIVATTPTTVAQETFKNGTSIVQSKELKGEKQVIITRQWSLSTTLSRTIDAKVKAGIPEVASVESGYSWTVSNTSTFEVSSSVTEVQSWTWPIQCPACTSIFAKATMYGDNIDTEYEADMELHLVNGKVFKYKEKGVYSGLNARAGQVTIDTIGPYP